MADRTAIYADIESERGRQIGKGYDAHYDAEHGVWHLTDNAIRYARHAGSLYLPHESVDCRAQLVKATALLVAALELHDTTRAGAATGGDDAQES